MHTLQFLAPILGGLCINNFMEKQGDFCNLRQEPPSVIKYYEPGMSCYKNGIFYEKCENSPEVKY